MIQTTRALAIDLRTYLRPKDDQGTAFETRDEMISRAYVKHHQRLFRDAGARNHRQELEELAQLAREGRGSLAGRTQWLGGTPYAYDRAACQFNCSFDEVATVYDLVDAAWLLLNGSGYGFKPKSGTLHGFAKPVRDVVVIPSGKGPRDKGRECNFETLPAPHNGNEWYISVGDSAVAWAKALGKLFSPRCPSADRLVLDFSEVRGAGGRLKGYGWICNGYAPLATAMRAIVDIQNASAGHLLDEIAIMDVVNWLGTILSSRRAAELCELDAHSPKAGEFRRAKFEYWKHSPQRRQSNNTLIYWSKPSRATIEETLREADECGGDPAVANGSAAVEKAPWFVGFNPCAEILLARKGFCVAGDTWLITRDGVGRIGDLVGRDVEVWNGERWSRVTPRITGEGQPLVRVELNDGSHLDCTPDHRFSIRGRDGRCREVEARALPSLKGSVVCEPFEVRYYDGLELPDMYAYSMGLVVGDGNAEGDRVRMTLYGAKALLPCLGSKGEPYTKKGYNVPCVEVTDIERHLDIDSVRALKYDPDGLRHAFSWSKRAILQFMAGWLDADGSETGSGGVRLYLSSRGRGELAQLLLRKCGIRCSLNLQSEKGEVTNLGVRREDVWYLQITDCQRIPCRRLDTTGGHAPVAKGREQLVRSVSTLPGLHTTYCLDEPYRHKCVFNNVLTFQCNLVTTAMPRFRRDFAGLERAVHLLARANYRQTCVDLEDGVLQPGWHQTNEALRLCGVSMTGIVQADWLTDYQIRRLRNAAITGAYSMADELRLPRPKAVTTVKPEGTISKTLGGTDVGEIAEGVHKPLGRFIFNWVNFSAHDPVARILESSGYRVLPNPSDPNNVLVCFPVEYPGIKFDMVDGKEVNLEPAVAQLDRYLRWNTLWADHNVSCTVSYSPEEIPEIAEWIDRNWDRGFVACSFLRRNDPTKTAKDLGHPYLPQEVVTEGPFREYQALLRPVDFSKVSGIYDIEQDSCATGACPVK